mgnify:CR=1 FL=1
MKFKISDLVLATSGREKGEYFIIKKIVGNNVMLVNGKTRPLSNPKVKNIKHIKFCKNLNLDFKFIHDCDIIYEINMFKRGFNQKVEEN